MKPVRILCISLIGAIPFLMPNLTKAAPEAKKIKIIQTTDVHGNFFPYNFIERTPWGGSMARVATFVDSVREAEGADNVLLLDNGDILQGQPTVYYYNFIDTASTHLASRIYDFLGYDAATIGNHDVETGHEVYDRWIRQTVVPVLGANVIDRATGLPYLKPYKVFERGGIRIAVLGLLTPAVPAWLPENLWKGLEFEDMESAARKWVPLIREKEKPDILIGLFHSGHEYGRRTGDYRENASLEIARTVPGFDIVMMGHDHQRFNRVIANASGDSVVVVNPANNAVALATVDIMIEKDDAGNILGKKLNAAINDIAEIAPSRRYMDHFASDLEKINGFVDREIGSAEGEFSSQEAFFGPSAFIDLIHSLQLKITGADVSFAAPLSFDAVIHKGPVRVSDMFNLYKYENLLYTMQMTGKEIRNYLEKSYSIWINTIGPGSRHLLQFADKNPSPARNSLRFPSYNFDSAAGIIYTVDVTKPEGERVNILSMGNGQQFDPEGVYKVAVNSYRGNGGGDLMTKGAGIPQKELKSRIISSTDLDLRYYLMKEIERDGTIKPMTLDSWKFVPEEVAAPAIERDKAILFPEK